MNFENMLKKTLEHEGLYSNDKDDKGGETYKGISRVANQNWKGWEIIDSKKDSNRFPETLEEILQLQKLVTELYYEKYFIKPKINLIDYPSIQFELFDTGVHCGTETAIRLFQKTINILNNNQMLYKNISTDGTIGTLTLNAFRACKIYRYMKTILNYYNGYKAKHYIECMERNEKYEKYIGFFNRVKIN